MSLYNEFGFSYSDLAGYLAALVLEDQKINHLVFNGFPEITVERCPEGFNCYFAYQGRRAGPLTVSTSESKRKVKHYKQGGTIDAADIRIIQPFMVELESRTLS